MTPAALLLFGLVGWTAIGLVGSFVSGVRRSDWPKARRGLLVIALVWTIYLAVLLTVSAVQPQRVLPLGTAQCFDEMCFTVVRAEQLQGYGGRGNPGERLLRVSIEVSNRGHSGPERESLIRAYLIDPQRRHWQQLPGLGGIALTAPVPAGGSILSQPIFVVPEGISGLKLVLTHGRWQPDVLVLGAGDSLFHRPVVMQLGIP